ncbi:MAG: NlpC/P60 family protein [Nocardioidaceae bacterium]
MSLSSQGAAVAVALAVAVAAVPSASAADDDTPPSRSEVQSARESATAVATQVGELKARLAMATAELEQVSMAAGKAVEAWNGARYQQQLARQAANQAQRIARGADSAVARLGDDVAAAMVRSYESGGSLNSLGVLMQGPSTTALLDQMNAYYSVTNALQSDLGQYESAQTVAVVLQDQAKSALQARKAAAKDAARAKLAAQRAVRGAEAAVESIAVQKDKLLRRLAQLQDISLDLARRRQAALEAEAAQRAAEQAAAEAAEQARQDQRSSDAKDPAPPSRRQSPPPQPQPQPQPEPQPQPQPEPDPTPGPAPGPAPVPPPPATGASTAIDFARAQLGEPYVWGAAGPDAWDCSGLTMGAWAAAGVTLPHWSVAQYDATTPISSSSLSQGDLLFWSGNGDPSTIYHVALYLGNGMMVHAPRPGRGVEIVSMYYWITPDLFTRV